MPNSRRTDGEQPSRPPKKKRSRRWIGYTLLILVGMILGGAGLVGAFVYKAYQTLPVYEDVDPSLTSIIYDRNGNKVFELAADENRTLVKIDELPKEVQYAFVATEDHRFYDHFGVDLVRLVGAIWANVKYVLGLPESQVEGASTITMQLSRNAFLTLDQTPMRKVQETLIAIDLEKRFTKDQILERYLNQISFGGQSHGIQAAAQSYFNGKNARDLDVNEAALLAGMLKAPSQYNPFDNPEGANKRRKIVLDLMAEHGYLPPERAAALKEVEPTVKRPKVTPTSITFNGDWYVDHVIDALTNAEVAARYKLPTFTDADLFGKGLKIYTALDLDKQAIAQKHLVEIMPPATEEFSGKKDTEVPQGAVVIMDHRSGHLLALVGGLEHKNMRGLNRATDSRRDPGSTIKPLVAYLPAIDLLGWGPATVIDDSPPRLNDKGDNVWPENYDFKYAGLKSMRFALEQSINAMAVRTLDAVTPAKGIEYGRKLGLPLLDYKDNYERNDEHLALTLGGLSKGVTPVELTAAYGVLGNMGTKTDPVIITKIENKFGEVVWEAKPKKEPVIPVDSAWLMVDVMKGSLLRGTAFHESQGWHKWPAAGKTGTTEEWHDAWFVGFTAEIVVGVWTGYDNIEGRKRLPSVGWKSWTGAGPPTRIWTKIMDELYKQAPPDWEMPRSIVKVDVCETSGKLPSPLCPPDKIKGDWFRQAYVPKETDDVHTMVQVVRQSWVNPKDNKPIDRYYLWQPGCAGNPEMLTLLKRPTTWVKHPKDPFNIAKYWPADWWLEVPTEMCTPVTQPATPGTGTGLTLPPVLPPTTPSKP